MNLVSLTLLVPVVLYFIVTESSKKHASLGKRKMQIWVASTISETVGFWQIVLRNTIKFLPWQTAHMMIFHGIVTNWKITPY